MATVRCHEEWRKPEARRRLQAQFQEAKPFPHVVIRPFLGPEGLQAVWEEIQKVDATEKETDLFRFFQTQDLAPRLSKATGSEASKKQKLADSELPALEALAAVFASAEYRELVQEVTRCGELCDRVDLATQVYAKGSHLLCHDDVIGTRKVSFIYYMTDPEEEWSPAEGGALELYSSEASTGQPMSVPTKELLPLADSLAIFLVEPGVSYHAVREVRGDRARVSLQGWLHAPSLEQTLNYQKRGLATLQQILETRNGAGSNKVNAVNGAIEVGEVTQDDFKVLSKWISPAYLDPEQLEAVRKQFEESSYAVLTEFLREDVAQRLARELEEVDRADGFQPDAEELPVPCYTSGVQDGWELVGPPHLRRFLRFCSGFQAESPHGRLGRGLSDVAGELFASETFLRWLKACTGLDPKNDGRPQVRRFRPGLDYTVAARGAQDTDEADLDAMLCFAMGGSEGEASTAAMEAWASEEVGGFECYLAADEEDETVEAQEVYRGADTDGPLVNLPAVPNALCLVMRDDKTLRFLKYVSRDAPSSRADVSASYRVDAEDSEGSPEGSPD